MAFGGAGPIHAFRLAELLKIKTIICPPGAGIASALGLLVTPMALDFAQSYIARLATIDWNYLNRIYAEMEKEALTSLTESGASKEEIVFERSADMRYVGQFYEISSPIPNGKLGPECFTEIQNGFYQAYEKSFSRYLTDTPIQALTWRLRAQCPSPFIEVTYAETQPRANVSAVKTRREAYFPEQEKFIECPVYERYRLRPGSQFLGPAIIEERESTTIVGVHSEVSVDDRLNLVIERKRV
jgi:N-methylhydantoinase A